MSEKEKRFEALVQGHSPMLYRYAYWLCNGNAATAEDVVQETFLRAWRYLDQLEDAAAAKSWLFTILRRENARRFERKRFDYADVEISDVSADPDAFDDQMDRHELRRAIARLDPKYRDPLLLQTLGGFSCEEIAIMMDLGKGAVMTRLFRAKKMVIADVGTDQAKEAARG